MNQELKQIKKLYGEKFSHLCRELFSTILENNGMLLEILTEKFAPNHFLYEDLIKNNLLNLFKNYIYDIYCDKTNISMLTGKEKIKETPEELMDKAGYVLKECTTEEEVRQYRKYYIKGERLCTFNGGRLNYCRVFFAVKKNVNDIKRENFENPERQDEYGTSVISIQFTKDGTNTLSIKNRYNHTVNNPDSTFSNNLDNIIPGLTESFENTYDIVQRYKSDTFEIPGYVRANDGRVYKFNYEINNVYYCPNNIIIDNSNVKKYDKEKYIIMDYFIIDLINKKVDLYNNDLEDSFIDYLKDISKINILKEDNNKSIVVTLQNGEIVEILINDHNQIIEYKNNNIKELGNWFMCYNKTLNKLEANNLEKIGNSCLFYNVELSSLECSNLKIVGHCFLRYNQKLTTLELNNLEEVGNDFLVENRILENINCTKLKKVGNSFLAYNKLLKILILTNLKEVGNMFLARNEMLEYIDVSNLMIVGYNFLYENKILKIINCSNLINVDEFFLYNNECLEIFEAINLVETGKGFLFHNNKLKKLITPSLHKIKSGFLFNNEVLEEAKCDLLVFEDFSSCVNNYINNILFNNQKVLLKV